MDELLNKPSDKELQRVLHLEGKEWFEYFSGIVALRFPGLFTVVNRILSGEEVSKEDMEKAAILDVVITIYWHYTEDERSKLLKELKKERGWQ